MKITDDQWAEARDAFARAGERFASLLTRVPDPHARATKSWSVAQTAAHMESLAWLYTTLVEPAPVGDGVVPDSAVLDGALGATTVDTVRDLNDLLLRRYVEERELQALAERIRQDTGAVLRATEGRDPSEAVDWLGGSRVPLAGLLAHLTNELLIHGWDIARPSRTPWVIPPRDAGLFLELFLVGVTSYGYGVLLDGTPRPPKRRIAVQFGSEYTAAFTLVLDGRVDGGGNRNRVTVEEPRSDNDVRVSFDPPTLNLMLFGRLSRARALFTGKVAVRGPRPWLLPVFLRTVHMPNN